MKGVPQVWVYLEVDLSNERKVEDPATAIDLDREDWFGGGLAW
jgi:hypothetical protein